MATRKPKEEKKQGKTADASVKVTASMDPEAVKEIFAPEKDDDDDENGQEYDNPLEQALAVLQAEADSKELATWQWRIERWSPETYKGQQTRGFCGYLPFDGSLADEAQVGEKWGGGHYTATLVDAKRHFVRRPKGFRFPLDVTGVPKITVEPTEKAPAATPVAQDLSGLAALIQAQNTLTNNIINQQSTQITALTTSIIKAQSQPQASTLPAILQFLNNGGLEVVKMALGMGGDEQNPVEAITQAVGELAQKWVDSRKQGGDNPTRSNQIPASNVDVGSMEDVEDQAQGGRS